MGSPEGTTSQNSAKDKGSDLPIYYSNETLVESHKMKWKKSVTVMMVAACFI